MVDGSFRQIKRVRAIASDSTDERSLEFNMTKNSWTNSRVSYSLVSGFKKKVGRET